MFASAGDVNDDGYADTFIGSGTSFTPSGQINLYLDRQMGSHQPLKPYERELHRTILVCDARGFDSNVDGVTNSCIRHEMQLEARPKVDMITVSSRISIRANSRSKVRCQDSN